MDVIALRDIYSTVPSVGRREPRERFTCPDALAEELIEYEMVKRADAPKPPGASSDGQQAQPASSSPVAPASQPSKPSTLKQPTKQAGAKRSR